MKPTNLNQFTVCKREYLFCKLNGFSRLSLRVLAVTGFFLFLFFLASDAMAQSTATGTRYFGKNLSTNSDFPTPDISAAAACQHSADHYNSIASAGYSAASTLTPPLACFIQYKYNGANSSTYNYSITSNVGAIALPCPSAGDARSVNMTLGYTHDPSGDKSATLASYADQYMALRAAPSTCISGGGSACSATLDTSAGGLSNVWIASSPNAQGLYRVSVDQRVTYSGASCTQTASEKMTTESTDAAPACDGTYGTVNGKAVCVPTGSGSRNLLQSSTGTAALPRAVGNPTAGSNAGLPLASRTPSGGTGNNDGGPVSPLDGTPAPKGEPLPTKAGVKIDGEIQIDTCGLPGKPACKIDETGTPTGPTNTGLDPLNAAYDSISSTITSISSPAGKDTSWGVIPFWLQPSASSCHPVTVLTLPAKLGGMTVTIDLCPVLPIIYTLMNLLWITFTFGATISMVTRVTSGGS